MKGFAAKADLAFIASRCASVRRFFLCVRGQKMIDDVPQDALAYIVECLLPCERRVVRRVCWAWRRWPLRPACEGNAARLLRPGPVLHVAVDRAAPLYADSVALVPFADPDRGQRQRWWGSKCRTLALVWQPPNEHDLEQNPTCLADFRGRRAEVQAWLRNLLMHFPVCRFVVGDTDLLEFVEFGGRWNWPENVCVVQTRGLSGKWPTEQAIDTETATGVQLVDWGRRTRVMRDGIDGDEGAFLVADGRHQCDLSKAEQIRRVVCGATSGEPHPFWDQNRTLTRCRCLEVYLTCCCANHRELTTHANGQTLTEPEEGAADGGAWPALEELLIMDDCSTYCGVFVVPSQEPRRCVRHLTRVIAAAPKLRRLTLVTLEDNELAHCVMAMDERSRRGSGGAQLEVAFCGTSDQLFSVLMGRDSAGNFDPLHPFARRCYVIVSISCSDPTPSSSIIDGLIAAYKSKETRPMAASLDLLGLYGPYQEHGQFFDLFPGLPGICFFGTSAWQAEELCVEPSPRWP